MNTSQRGVQPLSHDDAVTYAGWFRALSDPMRVRLLNLIASERRSMSVGELVELLPIAQSTVSHHLKILAEVRFILPERQGTSTRYKVNEACLECFPAAVRSIMGRESAPSAC
ncbi:metalloregulator ArsR/SmtB family transcription factor [Streptomyces sp. NPDC051940]|uniref:ArsR/SmtB family transcription factor n=1 Tax=Streptomyces sp. NPDC051940 TaxID=3155675 RepID=UPI003444FDC2